MIGYFINLKTSALEKDSAETIGGDATSIPSDYNAICNLASHGKAYENENWEQNQLIKRLALLRIPFYLKSGLTIS